ncbi:hypothetical protein [Anaeromyxobacter soli]|uniref:hypothetical protein n=1 Tax=Anaeromyxobacter soli TaxID=2922725 RepID=UPI001FB02F27|nr:hypothetical protein [Anaeromyxobacter sp. SG29]
MKLRPVEADERHVDALVDELSKPEANLELGDPRDDPAIRLAEHHPLEDQVPAAKRELSNGERALDGGVRLLEDDPSKPLSPCRRREVCERAQHEDEHDADERQGPDPQPPQPPAPPRAPWLAAPRRP